MILTDETKSETVAELPLDMAAMSATFFALGKYPEVWQSERYSNIIKGRCVAKGLHHLLLEENTEHKWSILGCPVAIVLSLEQYNPAEGIGGLLEEDPSSKKVSTILLVSKETIHR